MTQKYFIENLFEEKEPSISQSLENFKNTIFKEKKPVIFVKQLFQYYDEPQFWQYSGSLKSLNSFHKVRRSDSGGSGFSFFSKEEALLKCLSETIERYCNCLFLQKFVDFTGSYNQIKKRAVDPRSFANFSSNQLKDKNFSHFRIDNNSVFRWTKCPSLTNGKFCYVPSQTIYLSYPFLKKEPKIYPTISTGAAAGGCLSAALVRGVLEVVEREAFMIYYLNKLPAKKIQLEKIKDNKIQKLIQVARRYKLEILSLDLTTDLKIPVVASVLINRTNIGLAVAVGLKSSLNPVEAIRRSIEESFATLSWIREEYEKKPKKILPKDLKKDSSFLARGFLWYSPKSVRHLDFWVENSNKTILYKKNIDLTSGQQLKKIIKIFKKHQLDIYYKELMLPQLKKTNLSVVKAIVPQMHPLYLYEKYPYWGGERLYNVPVKLGYKKKNESELNKYPHPFL